MQNLISAMQTVQEVENNDPVILLWQKNVKL